MEAAKLQHQFQKILCAVEVGSVLMFLQGSSVKVRCLLFRTNPALIRGAL
jgi:hypothetical protein